MFRKHAAEELDAAAQERFIARVHSLPVVTSAVNRVTALYTGTKEHNRLFRFTLQTAESGLNLVVSTTKPVVAKLEKPIEHLNTLACQQLDRLQRDYPIITKPTDEVLKTTSDKCTAVVKPLTDQVKPLTERVGSVKEYSINKVTSVKNTTVDTVGGVKTYGMNKLNDAKTYGMEKMTKVTDLGSQQMTRVWQHPAGQVAHAKMCTALDLAHDFVDKHLPETEQGNQDGQDKLQEAPLSVWTKSMDLGRKVRVRMYGRISRRMTAVKESSLDAASSAYSIPSGLATRARTRYDGARVKVIWVWQEINKSPEEVLDSENENVYQNRTYERRLIATTRHVTQRLKSGLASVDWSNLYVTSLFTGLLQRATDMTHHLRQRLTTSQSEGDATEGSGVRKSAVDFLTKSAASLNNFTSSWISSVKDVQPTESLQMLTRSVRNGLESVADAAASNNVLNSVKKFLPSSSEPAGGEPLPDASWLRRSDEQFSSTADSLNDALPDDRHDLSSENSSNGDRYD